MVATRCRYSPCSLNAVASSFVKYEYLGERCKYVQDKIASEESPRIIIVFLKRVFSVMNNIVCNDEGNRLSVEILKQTCRNWR